MTNDQPPEPLFSAARTKLKRAEQFLQELEANLNAYRDSNPVKASMDTSKNPPEIRVEWSAVSQLPGTIIGDAVHNMRTALDLMASELTRLKNENDKDVYFPFAASEGELKAAIERRNFHKAGDDAVKLVKSFSPYRGGNELLRALHDLDIQDKHTTLIVAGRTMTIEVGGFYHIDQPALHEVAVTKHDIHYVFPEGGILAGRNVIQTLKELMELIDRIIEAFSHMVELRGKPAS